ncbi:PucR family transcriptional regulator, partial [Streptomyces sp. NPDC002039]
MCELLNRIWSRPRREWTRVLRKELPALAAGIVEELRDGVPGLSARIEGIGDEVVRQRVESALLAALGYRELSATRQDEEVARQQDAHGGGSLPTLKAVPSQGSGIGTERTGTERAGLERAGLERAGLERTGTERTGPERARRELFAVLTSDMPMSEIALAELAGAARWPLPASVRAIALGSPGETQQLAAVLDDALAGLVNGQPCLLVPNP